MSTKQNEAQRLADALERFGAGGGELVGWVECNGDVVWSNRAAAIGKNLYTRAQPLATKGEPVAKLHDDGYWTPAKTDAGRALNGRLLLAGSAAVEVYTHPSPTDLQAEYERGLEDAKKEVEQFNVDGAGAIVDAIEALKGKQ